MTEAIRPPALDPPSVRGIVFDLDGTLVDSYRPIAGALNHARAGFDLVPLPPEEVRKRVGRGLEVLIAELVGGNPLLGVRIMTDDYGSAASARAIVVEGLPASFAFSNSRTASSPFTAVTGTYPIDSHKSLVVFRIIGSSSMMRMRAT